VPGQRTAASEALLSEAHRHRLEAPHIFPAEVRNVLLKLERQRRIDADLATRALDSLTVYDIAIDALPDVRAYEEIVDVARRERLSVYDALYLWQAQREGIALATRDGKLVAVAGAHGVACLDLRGMPTWPLTN
jgi:predicted nucleic acid-binding protein